LSAVESIEKESASTRRVARVTGASRGVGAGVARLLLSEGCRVAVAARSESGLKDICMEARASNAIAVGDLRDPAFADRLKVEEPWMLLAATSFRAWYELSSGRSKLSWPWAFIMAGSQNL
jgi:NAD(P)-dependent dehydrogenase (short-subunit alcohol dehydrogenase family)